MGESSHADFRGFTGTVAAGSIAPGDAVQILPSGKDAIIREVVLLINLCPRRYQSRV